MTISSTTTTVSYTGNASTVAFPVTFGFFGTGTTAEITVVERVIATGVETTKTNVTDYAVTGGGGSTGTVTAVSAPAATVEWHIRRNTTQTQETDYVENDAFPAAAHEAALDRATMVNQEHESDLSQALKYPDSYTGGASTAFPEPVAGGFITFNAAGDALTTSTTAAGQWLGGNGTVSLPYYTFSSDPDTGLYRIGANNIGVATNGVKQVDITTSGVAVTGTISGTAITGSGILSIDDTTTSTSGTTGSIHTDGGLGVAGTAHIVGDTTHGGDILSDTDGTDSIGSNAVRWLKGWFDSLVTTGNLDVAGDLTVTGNLTINGTTTNVDTTNMVVSDTLIKINDGATSNINDMGLLMERGSTGDNVFVGWDESGDYFAVGTTTADGDTTGNISYTLAQARLAGLNLSGTSADLGAVTTIDINGGTVDGAVVGGASAAAGTFTTLAGTTLTASTSLALATGSTVTGILDEDAMGTDSATQLATQQSIKAYVDNNAPENGIKFAFESTTTDTDQGAGKVWLNHATPSSATVLYIDDVEAGGVSVNAWADSMDDISNSASRGTIYIASYGVTNALLVFNVTGAVTSASTYSKVAVTHVLTVGTISDGDSIGVTFINAGADGVGDVVGPGSATDNAIARYDGTTGKLLQNSGVTIDDSGDVAITGDITANNFAGRNRIINGNFAIWQRGTSFTPTAGASPYTVDRWAPNRNTDADYTVSRQGTSEQYSIRLQRDNGTTGTQPIRLRHVIESSNGCDAMAGTTVTLSFDVKVGANYSAASERLNVNTITGSGVDQGLSSMVTNSWTSFATADSTNFDSLTTSWVRKSVQVAIGAGTKEIGLLFVWTPVGTAGADDWVELRNIQLELGSVATEFEIEDIGTTLAKCQRYYQRHSSLHSCWSYNTTTIRCSVAYSPQLRAAGTLSLIDTTPSISDGVSAFTGSSSAITNGAASVNGQVFKIDGFSGLTAWHGFGENQATDIWAVSAEL